MHFLTVFTVHMTDMIQAASTAWPIPILNWSQSSNALDDDDVRSVCKYVQYTFTQKQCLGDLDLSTRSGTWELGILLRLMTALRRLYPMINMDINPNYNTNYLLLFLFTIGFYPEVRL